MRREDGFTLAEVLVATFILAIGLVGIATGFQYATSGVETGKGESTAAFLTEQRLEQLKALALTNWTSAALAAGATLTCRVPGSEIRITPALSVPGPVQIVPRQPPVRSRMFVPVTSTQTVVLRAIASCRP